jgi:hypothetical protein
MVRVFPRDIVNVGRTLGKVSKFQLGSLLQYH